MNGYNVIITLYPENTLTISWSFTFMRDFRYKTSHSWRVFTVSKNLAERKFTEMILSIFWKVISLIELLKFFVVHKWNLHTMSPQTTIKVNHVIFWQTFVNISPNISLENTAKRWDCAWKTACNLKYFLYRSKFYMLCLG